MTNQLYPETKNLEEEEGARIKTGVFYKVSVIHTAHVTSNLQLTLANSTFLSADYQDYITAVDISTSNWSSAVEISMGKP
jgi:hypothetical protein